MPLFEGEEADIFESIRFQIRQLGEVVSQKEEQKRWQWKEDAEVLQAYNSALTATKAVLKEDHNRISSKIQKLKRQRAKKQNSKEKVENGVLSKSEVQQQLDEFRRKVKEAETRVEQAVENLSVAVRREERSMLEDQITLMKVRPKTQKSEPVVHMDGAGSTVGDT